MITLHKGKTKFVSLPWTIGQTVTKKGLVAIASGQLVPAIAGTAGAAIVGVTDLNRDWLYTHDRQGKPINIAENITNAIVSNIKNLS